MTNNERIAVYIKIENGITKCMCCVSRKKCNSKDCDTDVVTRDKYDGWESTWKRNKYGK